MEQPGGLESLPDAVLLEVLARLPTADRVRSSRVSRRWRRLSLEPGLNRALALRVFVDVEDMNARGFGLGVRQAAAALRGAHFRSLEALELRVQTQSSALGSFSGFGAPARPCNLKDVIGAGAPTLRSLTLGLSAADAWTALSSARLAESAPQLESLEVHIDYGQPMAARVVREVIGLGLPHQRLARLNLELNLTRDDPARTEGTALLDALPSLTRVARIQAARGDVALLERLAASGVRCAAAALSDADVPSPLGSLLRPLECPPQMRAHASLDLVRCRLPAAWPEGSFAGIESLVVRDCLLTPENLEWISGGAHAATLDALGIAPTAEDLESFGPGPFLSALEALARARRTRRDPFHLFLHLPLDWPALPAFLAALASSELVPSACIEVVPVERWGELVETWKSPSIPPEVAEAYDAFTAAYRAARPPTRASRRDRFGSAA